MRKKLSVLIKNAALGIGLSIATVVTYNNWILGPYLNHELFAKDGSVSEFSALTQPHYWVFRSLDILAGALLVVLAYVFAKRMPVINKARNILIGTTAVLGLANIIDAIFVLPCSETLNSACSIPVNISFAHFEMPNHGYSSVVIAITYLVLPIAGLIYAAQRKLWLFMLFSAINVFFALESLLSALIQYQADHGFSVRASGVSQEMQMLALAAWFICWGVSLYVYQPTINHLKKVNEEQAWN